MGRPTLQDLIYQAGVQPVVDRQPCLPAPTQPAIIASEEDHNLARNLLVDQRRNNPSYKDPSKQFKNVFKTSKEKDKLKDINKWDFSQDELDHALSAVIDQPTTSPGLVQAFISLGAKVNFVETLDDKKGKGAKQPNISARRRSTVLQRAATVRRADNVSLLASSGADQTTLDEALRAALGANDHPCVRELLRHGANINTLPNALADAVRSNDQNLVQLLLRAPKALRTEIISSCLPAAVQHKSEPIVSTLIGYGADPNFNDASALKMAISSHEYRLAVALLSGPIRTVTPSLIGALELVVRVPTAHQLHQFLQLLFCCGLPPNSPGLPSLLVTASKRNDSSLAHLLIDYGVPTAMNEAECLRNALTNSNWELTDAILKTAITPAHASVALAVLPVDAPKQQRLQIIGALLQKGASGPPLGRWLIRAVEDGESQLMDLLLRAGAPLESSSNKAMQLAIIRKDMPTIRKLLETKPSARSLAQLFPLLGEKYTPTERLETARLLLEHGARGVEVDRALLDAVKNTSASRDVSLVTEFVRYGADVNYENGKIIQSAAIQGDLSILKLLCTAGPSIQSTSSALPNVFSPNGNRHASTLPILQILLANGAEETLAITTIRTAVNGGPENLDLIIQLIKVVPNALGAAFHASISLENPSAKSTILQTLLKMGVAQNILDDALIVEVKRVKSSNFDTETIKLLLSHGATVNHRDGEALSVAVASGSKSLIRILLSSSALPSRAAITRSFHDLFSDMEKFEDSSATNDQQDIICELVQHGVEGSAIDSALPKLIKMLRQNSRYERTVDLLLQHGAKVNHEQCSPFKFAAQDLHFTLFAKMLSCGPDFGTIMHSLPGWGLDERAAVEIIRLCFDNGCTSEHFETGTTAVPLISFLEQYPRCDAIVKLLLDHGSNPDSTFSLTLDSSIGNEMATVLIYALSQPQKRVSSSVILAMLNAGASPTRSTAKSEITPISLAAREGRHDIVEELLKRGADASARDKWNRSALFYASSTSIISMVQLLSAHALKDDGSLHEAARSLQLEVATILIKQGHSPNFPCRLHTGRNALGELCLNAEVTTANQRTRARQLIRLLLDSGANPRFKARNERSAIVLALDNPHSPFEITEALLETEVWEDLNDEKHMFLDAKGFWYSPLKYVELVDHPNRTRQRQDLLELLQDKGCEPKYYSSHLEQPDDAIGMPSPIAKLADRQKEHELSLKLAKEASDHARMIEETNHRDLLRRKQEQQDAEAAAAVKQQSQWEQLETQRHEVQLAQVRSAERMKRSEKVAWHNLQVEQDRDFAAQRQQIEERKASVAFAHEQRLIKERQKELDHRAAVERKALKEKEELYERNVKRQKEITQRLDESAQLHARLRQDRPAIEGPPPGAWGTVD